MQTAAPSPDLIAAITTLLQAAGGGATDQSFFSADRLNSMAAIFGALAWPCIAALALILFRTQIALLITRIKKLGVGNTSIEAEEAIQQKVNSSAEEILSSSAAQPSTAVSGSDVKRSLEVGALSQAVPPEIIHSQIEQISAEYEAIRATLPSGPVRTKQMGAVIAKMRTLGRAVFPYRQELVNSSSPGRRLFAIAALQMLPDYNLVDWLASRMSTEVPYIQFQALNALLTAVRNAGPQQKKLLQAALGKAKSGLSSVDPDKSRWTLATSLEEELSQIPDFAMDRNR